MTDVLFPVLRLLRVAEVVDATIKYTYECSRPRVRQNKFTTSAATLLSIRSWFPTRDKPFVIIIELSLTVPHRRGRSVFNVGDGFSFDSGCSNNTRRWPATARQSIVIEPGRFSVESSPNARHCRRLIHACQTDEANPCTRQRRNMASRGIILPSLAHNCTPVSYSATSKHSLMGTMSGPALTTGTLFDLVFDFASVLSGSCRMFDDCLCPVTSSLNLCSSSMIWTRILSLSERSISYSVSSTTVLLWQCFPGAEVSVDGSSFSPSAIALRRVMKSSSTYEHLLSRQD